MFPFRVAVPYYWRVELVFPISCSYSTFVPGCDSSCFHSLFLFTLLRNNCSYQWVPFYRICSFLLACGTIVPNHLFLFMWNGSYFSFCVPLVDSSYFDSLFRFTVLRNDCSFSWVPFHRICSFLLACGTIVPNRWFLFMWNGSYSSFYVPLVDSSHFDSLFRFDVLRNNCSYQGVFFAGMWNDCS